MRQLLGVVLAWLMLAAMLALWGCSRSEVLAPPAGCEKPVWQPLNLLTEIGPMVVYVLRCEQ